MTVSELTAVVVGVIGGPVVFVSVSEASAVVMGVVG